MIAKDFAERLDTGVAGYTFGIFTMGGIVISALHQLNTILMQGCRRKLDTAFTMKMPANFPPFGRLSAVEKKNGVLVAVDIQPATIATTIGHGIAVPPGFSPFSPLLRNSLYPAFIKNVPDIDKAFSVSDACTSCRTCENLCPAGNIIMENGRPSWQHHCELCYTCLHFCPVEAIQFNTAFLKNARAMDKMFLVSDTCTSCGTCEKVCPTGNIIMIHDRPSWQHHCELCCTCLHFCPVEAIQLNTMQAGTVPSSRPYDWRDEDPAEK